MTNVVKQRVHDSLGIVRQRGHRIGARGAKRGDVAGELCKFLAVQALHSLRDFGQAHVANVGWRACNHKPRKRLRLTRLSR